jgi:catalase
VGGDRSRRVSEYELGVQIFTEAQADGFTFDVLGPTKIVPEEIVPVTPIGRMILKRDPDNFFAETEQVAFCAAHVVPGIDFSNDPLLAGRIHSYVDTQISRLGGPNFHEIPINAPVAQVSEVDQVLGRKLLTANNRSLGRLEESHIERAGADWVTSEWVIGPAGLLERLGLGTRLLLGNEPRGLITAELPYAANRLRAFDHDR